LQQLMVDGSRLLSLAAVCYCRALTHLSVAACQLGDLEGVGACAGLQQLHAPHNDIADLAPLAGEAQQDHSRGARSQPRLVHGAAVSHGGTAQGRPGAASHFLGACGGCSKLNDCLLGTA
jgi:hypothetical protein